MIKVMLLLLLYFIPLSAQSTWRWINPLPGGNYYRTVKIISPDIWMISGNYGSILRSTNKGISWTIVPSGTTEDIMDMYFPNTNYGFGITYGGKLLITSNGGLSWYLKDTGLYEVTKIYFIDSLRGFLLYPLYRTTDGGNSWWRVGGNNVNGIAFSSPDIGFTVGNGGAIYKSTNSGLTWSSVFSPTEKSLNTIIFINSTGIIVGVDGTILKSTNSGTDWEILSTGPWQDVIDVLLVDSLNYYIHTSSAYVLHTSDGGLSWNSIFITTESWTSVAFQKSTNAIAVGPWGSILTTSDGGMNWRQQRSGTTTHFLQIIFPNESIGYITGTKLLKSNDAGLNWNEIQTPIPPTTYFTGSFPSINTGYLIWNGHKNGNPTAFAAKTEDGGNSWDVLNIPQVEHLNTSSFIDENNGYIAGYSTILKTTDGGNSWSILNSGYDWPANKIFFSDIYTGYLITNNPYDTRAVVLKTTNGGSSWNTIYYSDESSIANCYFLNAMDVFIVGYPSMLLKTTNGGSSWQSLNSGTALRFLESISFSDKSNGQISTDHGRVLLTSDGGNTWRDEITITNNDLLDSHLFSSGRVISVGVGGTILMAETSSITSIGEQIEPMGYELYNNFPNPFNSTTTIKYYVNAGSKVSLKIFNILGKEVSQLVNKYQQKGSYEVQFNASGLPSGIYFCLYQAGPFRKMTKMVYVK